MSLKMKPRLQDLRTTVACFFLVLCIIAGVAWPYTYYANYEVVNNVVEWKYYSLESWKGKVQVGAFGGNKVREFNDWVVWRVDDERMHDQYAEYTKAWKAKGLGVSWTEHDKSVTLPYWLLVTVTGTLAVLLKPKPRLSFAMADVLIFTTVLAVVVGGIAVVFRTIL